MKIDQMCTIQISLINVSKYFSCIRYFFIVLLRLTISKIFFKLVQNYLHIVIVVYME